MEYLSTYIVIITFLFIVGSAIFVALITEEERLRKRILEKIIFMKKKLKDIKPEDREIQEYLFNSFRGEFLQKLLDCKKQKSFHKRIYMLKNCKFLVTDEAKHLTSLFKIV